MDQLLYRLRAAALLCAIAAQAGTAHAASSDAERLDAHGASVDPAGDAPPSPDAAPLRVMPLLPEAPSEAGGAPALPADADEVRGDPLALKPALRLDANPRPPPMDDSRYPLYIKADELRGRPSEYLEGEGDVELRRRGVRIFAQHLRYAVPQNVCTADGDVRVEREGDVLSGPMLSYDIGASSGYIAQPSFVLSRTPGRRLSGRGEADRAEFIGPDQERLTNSRYTTCPAGQDDWYMQIRELDLDRRTQVGTAHDASIVFKGVPILYSPWLNFPLSGERKTGLLTPSFGSTGNNGLEFTLPWYWNIAPNMDDTLTPRPMSKRGLQVANEFRYLEPKFSGKVDVEYLPDDRILGVSRHYFGWQHNQNFANGWTASVNVQGASDDAYFRDLSTRLSTAVQSELPRQAVVSYGGQWWNFSAQTLRYQVLQDPLNPVVTPYALRPQLTWTGARPDVRGFDLSLQSELVSYEHPTLVNGSRFTLYPSVSFPILRTYGFLTPKFGLHYTEYRLGANNTTGANAITRVLPIASVDSGLYFDRDVTLFNTALQQTLEPRLYYVHIPYRDQGNIPNFATAAADFNFAQLFSENRFIGGDRINDADQLSAALTTRYLESADGFERLRAAIGQRYYFASQQVTLPGVAPVPAHRSDLLLGLAGQINRRWSLDSTWQYSTNESRTIQTELAVRYRPEPGKVLNVGYRMARENPDPTFNGEEVDFSTQWPLTGRWYLLARYNYSLLNRSLLEGLVGLEYNRDCWSLRLVAHKFRTATQQVTTGIFVQLELGGLSKIGVNPLEVLRQNIPGYTKSDEVGR